MPRARARLRINTVQWYARADFSRGTPVLQSKLMREVFEVRGHDIPVILGG
jgi:hypothetical protein